MKRTLLFVSLILGTMVSCQQPPTADEILLKAMEAHGGIDAWKAAKEIMYRKQITLYDSLGGVESKETQFHRRRFGTEIYADMQWVEDSTRRKATYINGEIISRDADAILKQTYFKRIQEAQYVFWQPYKLLERGTSLNYQGIEPFDDERQAHVLEVTYPDQPDSNTWWYFFDVDTYKLMGTMVEHGTTYSLIVNTSYEDKTGLSLNRTRESYRVDKDRNIQYLRASYVYDIFEWKN